MAEITKISGKDIDKSIPITNDNNILSWLCNSQINDYKNNRKSLMSDLRNQLKTTFGKQNKTSIFEYRTWVWKLSYDGLTYNIFSAPNKGTSIELCSESYEDLRLGKYTIQIEKFLEQLSKTINRPK